MKYRKKVKKKNDLFFCLVFFISKLKAIYTIHIWQLEKLCDRQLQKFFGPFCLLNLLFGRKILFLLSVSWKMLLSLFNYISSKMEFLRNFCVFFNRNKLVILLYICELFVIYNIMSMYECLWISAETNKIRYNNF